MSELVSPDLTPKECVEQLFALCCQGNDQLPDTLKDRAYVIVADHLNAAASDVIALVRRERDRNRYALGRVEE